MNNLVLIDGRREAGPHVLQGVERESVALERGLFSASKGLTALARLLKTFTAITMGKRNFQVKRRVSLRAKRSALFGSLISNGAR